MRERIFKAKRKNWKELPKEQWWVEGAIFEGKENSYIITNVKLTDEWEDSEIGADVIGYLVDPETICEPTGMTDRDGKKIFENDIVRNFLCIDDHGEKLYETGIVAYDEETLGFFAFDDENNKLNISYMGNIEVIENKFDNPELI